jgi:hypothetical protein
LLYNGWPSSFYLIEFYKSNIKGKHLKYLEENISAENIQLSEEDLQSIEAIMPAGVAAGTRYPERFLNALNR